MMLSGRFAAAGLTRRCCPGWSARTRSGRASLGTEFGTAVFDSNHPATFRYYPRQSIDLSRQIAFRALTPADRAELRAWGHDEATYSDWFPPAACPTSPPIRRDSSSHRAYLDVYLLVFADSVVVPRLRLPPATCAGRVPT